MIYATVPVETLVDASDLLAVRSLLKENQGVWFTARKIAEKTGLPTDNTQVLVRRVITELIECYHAPIVSCHAGYTWTNSPNMIKHYRDNLVARSNGLQRRIMAVQQVRERIGGEE